MIGKILRKLAKLVEALHERVMGETLVFNSYTRKAGDFEWKKGKRCPIERVEGAGVILADKLYILGGYQRMDRVLDRIDVFDFTLNKWVGHIKMPSSMAQTHSAICTDNKRFIYIFGGQLGANCAPCTDKCFVLDTHSNKFSEFVSLPAARYVGVAHLWNGRIHVVGGSLQDRFTPATDHWSIAVQDGKALDQWREEVPIPRGGIHRGSALIDNTLYVVGGSEGDVQRVAGDPQFLCNWKSPWENLHGEVYKLEAGAAHWTRLADMPLKLAHTDTTLVGLDHEILIFGGTEEKRTRCSNSVLRYDIAADRWETIGILPYHIKSTIAVHHQGHFYLVTGQRAKGINDLRPGQLLKTVWIAKDPRITKNKASSSVRSKRIGVLPLGGENWIAGVNYLKNICQSLKQLPTEEQPKLLFICRCDANIADLAKQFELDVRDFHCFAYYGSDSPRTKFKCIIRSLANGRWPYSFKGLIKRLRIDAFAPMMETLGLEMPVPWIGWIPDFQHKHLPHFFPEAEVKKRDKYFHTLIHEADHVIVSSRDAYQGLMKWFPTKERKVSVFNFPFITNPQWYEGDAGSVVRKFGLPDKFLMFPGQFWVHKNHKTLFEAIRILVKEKKMEDVVLVCSGRQHDYRFPDHFASIQKFIETNRLQANIRLLGMIDRHEQIQLMRASAAIVQPSLFEGWCLMIEEARSLGKRIFISDLPIHREQDPPHAIYFDPHDAQALAGLLKENWAQLKPGVDVELERSARQHSRASDVDFARRFNQIIEKTLQPETAS